MKSQYCGPRLLLHWHEIRAMGLSRAWWRARYEVRKRLGLVARKHGPDPEDADDVLGAFATPFANDQALLDYFRQGGKGRFCVGLADTAAYAEVVPDAGQTISAAQEVLDHHFSFLGQRFDFSSRDIDWHLDPESGQRWPMEPWDRIDISGEARMGDVKYIWELNRHSFWPTLGRAYLLTGDERYAAEWVRQFESWCEQNPPEIGVNWRSNLEHALRLISWWFAVQMMLDSPHVTAFMFRRLMGLVVAKARHIVADLDYSLISMANNHAIADATALALVGMAIPELREAQGWRDLGLRTLWQEANRQVYPDGCSFEGSACYQRFVLQFYLLVIILADLNGAPVPPEVRRRVEAMAEFIMVAMRSDGTLPQFGDWDSGLAYRLGEAPLQDMRPCLSTAAVLFKRGDFKAAASRLDQETVWLLGPEAAQTYDDLRMEVTGSGNRAFLQGGLFIQRRHRPASHLLLKNGPFPDHAHADLLSVWLYVEGQPLLTDSGTYTYNGSWSWRTYFRDSSAHNTVTVDGQGQALAHRTFRWLCKPTARSSFFAPQGRFLFDGEHDGYSRLGVRHRRIVLEVDGATWLLLDVLAGRGTHAVDVRWHLAADLTPEQGSTPGTVGVLRHGRQTATIASRATSPLALRIACGEYDPLAGWYSAGYGLKACAPEIVYSAEAKLPFCAATVLTGRQAPWTPTSLSLKSQTIRVALKQADRTLSVTYHLLDASAFRFGQAVRVGELILSGRDQFETLSAECIRQG